MDKRYFNTNDIEIRVADDLKSLIISGFIPTEQLSHTLYHKKRRAFFKEKVRCGAFSEAIKIKQPLLLLNHDYDKGLDVLNFEWSETQRGLRFEAEVLPDIELIEAIQDDCINGVSFGFNVEKDVWERVNGELIRTVVSFKSLTEISVLCGENNQPAYPQTSAFASDSRKFVLEKELQHLKQLVSKLRLEDMKKRIDELKSKSK